MNDRNNILGLYRFNVETFESNTNNEYQPLVFVEFDDNRNQILLRNSNLTFNPRSNKNILQIENSSSARLTLKESGAGTDMKHVDIVNNNGSFIVENLDDNRSGSAVILQLNRKTNTQECDEIFLNCSDAVKIRDFAGPTNKFTFTMSNGDLTCTTVTANLSGNISITDDTTTNSNLPVVFTAGAGTNALKICSDGILSVNPFTGKTSIDLGIITQIQECVAIRGTTTQGEISFLNSTFKNTFFASVTANTEFKLLFIDETESATGLKYNSSIKYNPSTSILTCTNLNATTIDATNLEVTNLKAKDGSACASIADSTGAITFTANLNATTVDSTNLEVTNLKAKDGSACASIADSTGNITFSATVNSTTIDSTNLEVTNLKAKDGSACASIADSTGNITFSATVTGDVSGNVTVPSGKTLTTTNGTFNCGTITGTGGNLNMATAQFSNGFFGVSYPSNANSLLFISSVATNGRQMLYSASNLTFNTSTNDLGVGGNVNIGSGKKYQINGANLDTDDIGEGSTNLYSPFTESSGTITYAGGDVSVTGGILSFPFFQISGTSSSFMGALGFNRNVSTGAILNSSFKAYQLHNNNGEMFLQLFDTDGTALSANVLSVNGQNVGIGVSTAQSALHIAGARDNNTQVDGIHFGKAGNDFGAEYVGPTSSTGFYNDYKRNNQNQDFEGRFAFIYTSTYADEFFFNKTINAVAFDPTSDDRLKSNETNITNGLETINKLSCEKYDKILEFRFKDDKDAKTMKEAGFIAQEVYEIDELKDYVKVGNDDNAWGLNYDCIFTYAVRAIQELDSKVNILETDNTASKNKISNLETENTDLKNKISNLETENTDLKNKISNLEADILLIKNNLSI
jgi:uncharacterized protein with FMN-binding domain